MRDKARASYKAAVLLKNAGDWNGAANRAYYALYQAIVGELEQGLKLRPENVDPIAKENKLKRDPTAEPGEEWRHSIIRSYEILGSKLHFDNEERRVVRQAWSLRVQGDYGRDSVDATEFGRVLKDLPGILKTLGVDV